MKVETIIFDWKRTLYDPESKTLTEGAHDALTNLAPRGLQLFLVGKDIEGTMHQELVRLNVADFFTHVAFVKESKSDGDLVQFISEAYPERCVVVGDRVRSEIEIGNRLGAITIQVLQGKFASELPLNEDQSPTIVIDSLLDLVAALESIT